MISGERSFTARIDDLLKGNDHTRSGLAHRPYFAHNLAHDIKHFWAYLEARREADPDILCVWVDLNTAIDALPEPDQTVVRAYAAGFRALELRAITGQPAAGAILQRGINAMSRFLNGETS